MAAPRVKARLQPPTASDLARLLAQPTAPLQNPPIAEAVSGPDSGLQGLNPASALAEPPGLRTAPSLLRHPEANRETVLNGFTVAYHFARGQRRTIGMRVDADGLQVRAPSWATNAQVQAVLNHKAHWILGKLRQQAQQAPTPLRFEPGTRLRVLDRSLLLCGTPAAEASAPHARVTAMLLAPDVAEGNAMDLRLQLSLAAHDPRWPIAVAQWLQAMAHRHFTARLDHFAPKVGVRWQRLRLSNATTRWGSASSDGTIRLHWRLMQLSPDVVDYVVVHELAHLREMNHSPRFWAVVRATMPDCERHRQALKQVRLATLG